MYYNNRFYFNPLTVTPPFLKNLKVHYLKLNCYNSWMLLNTDLRLVSFKEDNQQIIAEVKSFQKMKVKKFIKV